MSPILALIIQVIVQLILAWIKSRVPADKQPEVLKDFEAAYAEALAQKSDKPLRDLWKRLRGA